MGESDVEGAARMLVEAHRTGRPIARLPADMAPCDVEAAYAIQDAVAALRGPVAGWKISNGDPPTCSPTFRTLRPGARVAAQEFHRPTVEVEFGFVTLEELPPRDEPYAPEEVFERVACAPVIEIVSSRFADRAACSRFELLADGSNGALVVGDLVHPWRALDFRQIPVSLAINGVVVQSALGSHPLQNPATLVVWLANHAMRRGGLGPGVVATTGGLKGASPVYQDDHINADWDTLGRIEMTFT